MWADNADWESRKISLFIVLLLSSSCSPWPHVRSLDRTIMLSGFRRCLIAPYSLLTTSLSSLTMGNAQHSFIPSSYHICFNDTRKGFAQLKYLATKYHKHCILLLCDLNKISIFKGMQKDCERRGKMRLSNHRLVFTAKNGKRLSIPVYLCSNNRSHPEQPP